MYGRAVIPGDSTTYDVVTNLPMKLPCKSLCDAASVTGTTCGGLLEAFGVPMPCSDHTLFDTNVATCNAMTASMFGPVTVASHREPYIGSACAGITTETYLGATSQISAIPGLSPLLPPYVQQSLLEMTTAPIFDQVPRWLHDTCLVDMRRFFCALNYMPPQGLTSLAPVFGGPVDFPKFPSKALCKTYNDACAPFIKMVPMLGLDCSTEVAPGTPLFPETSVTLGAFPNGAGGFILLTTDANDNVPAKGFGVETQCPYAFSADTIDGIEDSRYAFMMGSNPQPKGNDLSPCKMTCPSLIIGTLQDYASVENRETAIQIISVILCGLIICNMLLQDKEKRNNHVFGCVIFIFVLQLVLALYLFSKPSESAICANPLVFEQGQTARGMILAIPGAIMRSAFVYVIIFTNACVTLEVWFRVYWQIKSIVVVRRVYTVALGIASLTMWLVPLVKGRVNAQGVAPFEMWNPVYYISSLPYPHYSLADTTAYFNQYGAPLLAFWILTSIFTIHIICYCISISIVALSKTGGESPLLKLWNTYRSLILLNVAFQCLSAGVMFFITLYEFVTPSFRTADYVSHIVSWSMCVIGGFTNLAADPTGGVAKCGLTSGYPTPTTNVEGFFWFSILPYILLIKVTFSESAGKFYWKFIPAPLQEILTQYCFPSKVHIVADKPMEKSVQMTQNGAIGKEETKEVA